MNPIISIIILVFSFYLLHRVTDQYFVDSLERIAQKYKLSSDITGATLMAIGSSSPELFIVIFALVHSGNHLAIGTGAIVGSAIFNILVISGAAALVHKIKLRWQPLLRDMLFYSIAIILLIQTIQDGQIDLPEATILILIYLIYIIAIFKWKKILPYRNIKIDFTPNRSTFKIKWLQNFSSPIDTFIDHIFPPRRHYLANFFISISFIAILSYILVENAIYLSTFLGIPESIIALTVLAIGTSIPDLVSSIAVSRQGNGSMAIGNIIGSNTFNILIGLGLPWFIANLYTSNSIHINIENLYGSIFLLFSSVLFTFIILWLQDWKIGRKAGHVLIGTYILYIIWEITKLI
ncbi:calcium/sodium antiporter [Patescibacteria group bacterium]|nr:calcium/sodium antiporter [Patescibacteria group bacterium]